jgi:hypothetical protein
LRAAGAGAGTRQDEGLSASEREATAVATAIHASSPAAEPLRDGALPPATRVWANRAFGFDFSRVRVHANDEAAERARAFNARAFTVGADIYVDRAELTARRAPRLLAHELAHVVQQTSPARHTVGAVHLHPVGATLVQREEKPGPPPARPSRARSPDELAEDRDRHYDAAPKNPDEPVGLLDTYRAMLAVVLAAQRLTEQGDAESYRRAGRLLQPLRGRLYQLRPKVHEKLRGFGLAQTAGQMRFGVARDAIDLWARKLILGSTIRTDHLVTSFRVAEQEIKLGLGEIADVADLRALHRTGRYTAAGAAALPFVAVAIPLAAKGAAAVAGTARALAPLVPRFGAAGVVAGPFGQVARSVLERAAAAAGPTTLVLTRLTQPPAIGRAISTATGPGARVLVDAARAGGQVFKAHIPTRLIAELEKIGLVQRSVTLMQGGITAIELRFLPAASEFVVKYFSSP